MRCSFVVAVVAAFGFSACAGDPPEDGAADVGDQEPLDTGKEDDSGPIETFSPGDLARVCNASAVNLRSGPGTTFEVLKVVPAGSTTKILTKSGTWYEHDWGGNLGWSSGRYLCSISDPGSDTGNGFASTEISTASFLSIGRAAVGFSYYWGGARVKQGGGHGACYGSCPSCSHSGSFGADCSGFIGKAWLLPKSLPMDANRHPYSTASFLETNALWTRVSRTGMQPGDALVYRSNGAGHMLMYEKDDPWGQFWSYEARGCSYGIVHNIRTAGSAYKGIRRTGL